jgi:hypothetical protein
VGEEGKVIGIGLLLREREREMKTWKSKRKWKTRKKRERLLFFGGGDRKIIIFLESPQALPTRRPVRRQTLGWFQDAA